MLSMHVLSTHIKATSSQQEQSKLQDVLQSPRRVTKVKLQLIHVCTSLYGVTAVPESRQRYTDAGRNTYLYSLRRCWG